MAQIMNVEFSAAEIEAAMRAAVEHEREQCAEIALAIDSGRGNEKEIARAIRARSGK